MPDIALAATEIVDTVPSALIVLDRNLIITSANRAFYQTFRTNAEETEGCLIYDLGNRQWDIPALRTLLETLRPGILAFWYHHGPMSVEDRRTTLRLLGQEVMPAVREIAKELDLPGPFEQLPGVRPLPASGKRNAVVNYESVAAAGR